MMEFFTPPGFELWSPETKIQCATDELRWPHKTLVFNRILHCTVMINLAQSLLLWVDYIVLLLRENLTVLN